MDFAIVILYKVNINIIGFILFQKLQDSIIRMVVGFICDHGIIKHKRTSVRY